MAVPPKALPIHGAVRIDRFAARPQANGLASARHSDPRNLQLYRSSVVVTGSHYSMTTVLGALLGLSPRFHLVNEPVNLEATLSFRTVDARHWYEFHDEDRYPALRAELIRLMSGQGFAVEAAQRLVRVRSPRDFARVGRLVSEEWPRRISARPAIFKAPMLAFTARTMQQVDGLRVVLGVRHPAGWVESVVRRDSGFDFANLKQPALLDLLPEYADRIRQFAGQRQTPLHEAVLLWQVIQSFHAKYLLGNEKTALFRQEDLVARPRAEAERLFAFAGVEVPAGLDRFLADMFGGGRIDHTVGGADYVQRDGQAVVDKWRDRLTADEQSYVRRATEELAASFGYGKAAWEGVPAA